MKIKFSLLLAVSLSLWLLAPSSHYDTDAAMPREAANAPTAPAVLVELFTSEGCSTCPPADKLLADLEQNQPVSDVQIIALGEHVDYWNQLGWKDPFSSAAFSQRQSEYAQVLGEKDIYTPQMIVDGRSAFVGSNATSARAAIAKAASAPKADVSLAIQSATPRAVTLTVQVENLPTLSSGDTADVMLALTESDLQSQVSRGENAGRRLTHSAVTRKLTRIGTVAGKPFHAEPELKLESTWKRPHLKAIVFVQERASRRVLGAAAVKLAGELGNAK